jgi:hypothetical protein
MTSAHATISRYTNDACRCIPCTDANTAYMREYRQKRTTPTKPGRGGSEAGCPGHEGDRT